MYYYYRRRVWVSTCVCADNSRGFVATIRQNATNVHTAHAFLILSYVYAARYLSKLISVSSSPSSSLHRRRAQTLRKPPRPNAVAVVILDSKPLIINNLLCVCARARFFPILFACACFCCVTHKKHSARKKHTS